MIRAIKVEDGVVVNHAVFNSKEELAEGWIIAPERVGKGHLLDGGGKYHRPESSVQTSETPPEKKIEIDNYDRGLSLVLALTRNLLNRNALRVSDFTNEEIQAYTQLNKQLAEKEETDG